MLPERFHLEPHLLSQQSLPRKLPDWITDYGDRDGDGLVEYERLNDQGLINQG